MAMNPNLKSMTNAKKVVGSKPPKLTAKPITTAKTTPPPLWTGAGMTTGAPSPTSPLGVKTYATPNVAPPILPQTRANLPGGGMVPSTGTQPIMNYAAAQAASTPTGGNNSGGGPTNTMPGGVGDGQVYDGWAKNVRPGAIPGLIQDPSALLANVMAQMGISSTTNPGLYGMAAPFADYANALTLLGLGTTNENAGSNNASLNFMGDYFSNLLTRGARGSDYGAAMQAIKGVGAGTDSPLAAYLNIDDPGGQADAYKSLIMPAAASGLHPLFARALSDKLDMLKTQYIQRSAFGTPPGSFGGMLGTGSVFKGQ